MRRYRMQMAQVEFARERASTRQAAKSRVDCESVVDTTTMGAVHDADVSCTSAEHAAKPFPPASTPARTTAGRLATACPSLSTTRATRTLGPPHPKGWHYEDHEILDHYYCCECFRQTARGRETTLRARHLDTLWSKYWLGRTLKHLEKYDEAAETLGETLEGREATLGLGHPDTIWSKY
jgi:hypothetical protein